MIGSRHLVRRSIAGFSTTVVMIVSTYFMIKDTIEYQKQIIVIFLNALYVYDDKLVSIYNIQRRYPDGFP